MPRLRALVFAAFASLTLLHPAVTHAQFGGGAGGGRGGGGGGGEDQDEAKRKKREQEFGALTAPLPQLKNAGPCPFVKVLYDAARYVDFQDDTEASANVRYSGEIQNVSSICAYKSDQPITVKARVLFELGRGPKAQGHEKTYSYWIAVTDRNHAVLEKTIFTLPVTFPSRQDRVFATEEISRIVIPRKDPNVSGANFEILIGFEVTPRMAAFNRDGKRFRPNAGQPGPQGAPAQP
jgi:hypothetical protein